MNMTRHMSLGDLITALYDTVDHLAPSGPRVDHIVAACTVDLLLRQRKPRLLAELVAERNATTLPSPA